MTLLDFHSNVFVRFFFFWNFTKVAILIILLFTQTSIVKQNVINNHKEFDREGDGGSLLINKYCAC